MKNRNLSLPKLSLPAINFDPARLLRAGALLAPIILLQAVRLTVGGGGPEASSAAPLFDGPGGDLPVAPAQQTRVTPLTPQQKAAVEFLIAARQDGSLMSLAISPFPAPKPKIVAVQPPPQLPQEPAIEQPEIPAGPMGPHLPEIPQAIQQANLTSLLRAGSGEFAVINGKPHRIGDFVIEGWRVIEIKVNDRAVLLEGPHGELVELSAPQG
jgi:hypothetical protein